MNILNVHNLAAHNLFTINVIKAWSMPIKSPQRALDMIRIYFGLLELVMYENKITFYHISIHKSTKNIIFKLNNY